MWAQALIRAGLQNPAQVLNKAGELGWLKVGLERASGI